MRWSYIVPVAVFVVIAIALGVGLTLNPRDIPSALIGKPVPAFELEPVPPRDLGLASGDLKQGEVVLINVFASWCGACRVEHPLLMEIARSGVVPVYGLAYKDAPSNSDRWLNQFGDPYTRTGVDRDGRVGIDLGVYGVPETFIVSGDGHILDKHIGPISLADLKDKILPLIRQARTQ